jgi:hypothetical protein
MDAAMEVAAFFLENHEKEELGSLNNATNRLFQQSAERRRCLRFVIFG